MYPAQTSLIPITVALARFAEAGGNIFGNYPYWYLGTTPFKYLTGPVVPYLLIGLRTIFPGFSFFDLAFFLIFISFFVQAAGWGIFVYKLSGNKQAGWMGGFLTLILPWHIISALCLGETSAVMAGAMTPWVLLAFVWGPVSRFLPADARSGLKLGRNQKDNAELRVVGNPSTTATPSGLLSIVNGQRSIVFPAVAFAFLLLTNTTASVSAIVGMILLSITNSKLSITKLKTGLVVVLVGSLLSLWWYTPGYWLTIWGAPGIGGKNIFGVLSSLADFLRGFLPVIAAMLFVFWKVKPKTAFEKFSLGWVVLFGSLTMFRFMADWDFWMDWTAWISEVEVGVALLTGVLVSQSFEFKKHSAGNDRNSDLMISPRSGFRHQQILEETRYLLKSWLHHVFEFFKTASQKRKIFLAFVIGYILIGWFLAWQNRDSWLPRTDISRTVGYMIPKILEKQVRPVETVFLSGTTAFWLNSLVDIRQVRGGRDEGSVDSKWRVAVWEVREGVDGSRSASALKSLGVDFLVVHTDRSSEYYHDFKNPEKFEDSKFFEQVYSNKGDIIYRIK